MSELSLDLRQRIVAAYLSGQTKSYASTAALFGVGYATVNRLLQRFRATGDVRSKPRGGNNPRRISLDWLREHASAHPDARAIDRIAAWEAHSGIVVSPPSMYDALAAIGWTHKKRQLSRGNASAQMSKRGVPRLSKSRKTSTHRV